MAIHFSKYWSSKMRSPQCAYISRSLMLIMAFFILSPVGLLKAQIAKQDVIFSGNPPIEPNATTGTNIKVIDGNLMVQNFDQATIGRAGSFVTYAGDIEKVTGTVTIKNLTNAKFVYFLNLKEIGGNFIMHDNPNLEDVDFLENNVSVKGSIEGKNSPKLCSKYSYLISVDKKYSNLFDEDCFTFSGDVDMLSKTNTIKDKTIINGSLTCNSATNPKFEDFDGLVLISLKNILSVGSLLLDNCPVASLSETLPSLKKVESTVQIINCEKLEDKTFSDWLYNIEIEPSNMIFENNKNTCLERKHVAEWESKNAKIPNFAACGEIDVDVDLSKPSTLINGTTVVRGTILCLDVKGTEFSPEAKKFLMNINSVVSLEFIRCEPFVSFKQIFPNGLPDAYKVKVLECPNFLTNFEVLEMVNGSTKQISIVDNPKVCYTEIQKQSNFTESRIKQRQFCGQQCAGGRVAYRNGIMKSNVNLTENCDRIRGELIFEGELPSKEEASLFANIRSIEGSLFFHGIKNNPITNRTFELLPNLQNIEFRPEPAGPVELASYFKYGCAVIVLDVKEIDHFDMRRLDSIKCGTKKCICIEGSPEYEKIIVNSDDWEAVRKEQATVAFYPLNVVTRCWTTVDYEKHIVKLVVAAILFFTLNPIILYLFFVYCDVKRLTARQLSKEIARLEKKERKRRGRRIENGGSQEQEMEKESVVTEPMMEEDSHTRLKSVQTDVDEKTKTETTETPKTPKTPLSKESKISKESIKSKKSKKSQSKKKNSTKNKGKESAKNKKKKMDGTKSAEN